MTKPELDLSNIDGNAFVIMAEAARALQHAGFSKEEISKYRKEATSGDYDNLLQVTMKYCEVT